MPAAGGAALWAVGLPAPRARWKPPGVWGWPPGRSGCWWAGTRGFKDVGWLCQPGGLLPPCLVLVSGRGCGAQG